MRCAGIEQNLKGHTGVKILVTGAAGYIGFHVATALRRDGHEVIGMTRGSNPSWDARLVENEVALLRADLGDADTYREALESVDAVVHVALNPDDALNSDLTLVSETAKAQAGAGRRIHFVYTSGFSVYGTHDFDVVDEETPIDENGFRGRVETALADAGIGFSVMRPGFLFGLDARHSPLATWFAQGRDGAPVHFGRTDKLWSWIHVADLAEAYVLLMRDPAAHDGEAYCLVESDAPVGALALNEQAARLAGFTGGVVLKGIEEEAADLRVFDRHEVGRNDKARRQLGWEPRHGSPATELETYFRAWAANA